MIAPDGGWKLSWTFSESDGSADGTFTCRGCDCQVFTTDDVPADEADQYCASCWIARREDTRARQASIDRDGEDWT